MNSPAELLGKLIAIPSVSPDGDPGTDRVGEAACAEFIAGFLEGIGAEARLEEVRPGRPNVIGDFAGGAGKERLVFAPHVDTVSVAGMTIDPFGGRLKGGRIWGRGASDTKGTMAAMLWALKELRDEIPDLACGVSFVGLMGEETDQAGSQDFGAKYGGDFAFAVVGEPTGNDIVHKHKGCLWGIIQAHGRAAHGAKPELGDSAIRKGAQIALDLESEFRDFLARDRDPVLGSATVNVGRIWGGSRANIVPDRCSLEIDVRIVPATDQAAVEAKVREIAGRHDPAAQVAFPQPKLPLDTPSDHPYVQRLLAANPSSNLVGAPWFCDAAYLSDAGIPSIAAGPGSIDQAHTADEWLAEDDLNAGVVFYRNFLESFRL
ncbi:MAG: M20/M25/M40 family metallo-hydrolase [Verrucomicrobiales bacterium]